MNDWRGIPLTASPDIRHAVAGGSRIAGNSGAQSYSLPIFPATFQRDSLLPRFPFSNSFNNFITLVCPCPSQGMPCIRLSGSGLAAKGKFFQPQK
jgi:hypothetical protein